MKTKYPRTFHLPYSLTVSDDDKRLSDDSQFEGMEVVVLEKMDGENTTIYPDCRLHARSLDGCGKPWQSWLQKEIQKWAFDIPENWRVCGENLYAKHSIAYVFENESKLFQVFNIWDEHDFCLTWDQTEYWCKLLGIETVPCIYRGIYDKDLILKAFEAYKAGKTVEGFVVRNTESFHFDDFHKNVGKYVRAGHVQTDEHWTKNWTRNIVKGE